MDLRSWSSIRSAARAFGWFWLTSGTVCKAIATSSSEKKLIIYPSFTPTSNPSNIAPGHLIFSSQDISIWQNDMLSFLRPRLFLNQRFANTLPVRLGKQSERSQP